MKKSTILLISTAFLIVVYLLLTQSSKPAVETKSLENPTITTSSSKVNYSAGFAIFTNKTFRIFTAAMYHNLSNDVYIQADNPNIVYVKKNDITWNDFFNTLPLKLTKDCLVTGTKQTFCTNANGKLRFYINGKEDTNALDRYIKNKDQLLVTYGNENDVQIKQQLQQIPDIN